ncbi:hypothetical protein V8E51_018033 [Hyaloscypha variabilis]
MSHRSYAQQKVIVHSRDSSVASTTSSKSQSSAEGYSSSPSSRTSMTNGFDPAEGLQYRRVPDNEDKYIISKTTSTSRGGTIEIHNHLKARHVAAEPRASEATYEDYKRTQEKPQK